MERREWRRWLPLGVFALVALVFLPALGADFVTYDDPKMLLENRAVAQGLSWAGLRWAFTTWYWGMWHPLTWVSHQLDFTLFGARPLGHHAVSLLLHAATCALACAFLQTATGQAGRSALVALLFGLHPLRAESVVWVAERKDVLCTLFSALALLLYLRYRKAPGVGRWLAVTLAVVLALLCKPTAVALPFVLLLLDLWPLGPTAGAAAWRSRVLEKLPWVALAAGASALTVAYQQSVGAVTSPPLAERLPRVAAAYGLDLWHTVWPLHLSYLYPRADPGALVAGLSALALAALLAGAWLTRRRAPAFTTGVLWFLGVVAPTAGLVQVGGQLTADRYTYFPHLGLFTALVFAVPEVPGRYRRAAALFGAALVAGCGGLLWGQIAVWSDSEALFTHALERDPGNMAALHSLALLEVDRGRPDEAIVLYRRALALEPDATALRASYVKALLAKGELGAALQEAQADYARWPKVPWVAGVYGKALGAAGRCREALPVLRALEAERPPDDVVELDLGACLLQVGRLEDAWAVLARGVARFPEDVTTPVFAAQLALDAQRPDLARAWLDEATRRGPGDPRLAALRQRLP